MARPSKSLGFVNDVGYGPLLFYHPNEIGVTFPEILPDDDPALAAARYNVLREELNRALKRIEPLARDWQTLVSIYVGSNVRTAEPAWFSAFIDDTRPDPQTLDYVHNEDEPLKALSPLPIHGQMEHPWVVPSPVIQSDNTHCFFGVGSGTLTILNEELYISRTDQGAVRKEQRQTITADITQDTNARMKRIRDLINLINLGAPMGNKATNAFPNWLHAATGSCPCPGSPPEWIPDARVKKGYWSFQFTDPALNKLVLAERARKERSKVVVAILDTSPITDPTHETIDIVTKAAKAYPKNVLLQKVNSARHAALPSEKPLITIGDDDPRSIPETAFHPLGSTTINWRNKGKRYAPDFGDNAFRIDDHGLFVTGIIHDIAPKAEIHLIRVLGGFGVCDMRRILPVLKKLPSLIDDTQRLVVNLSLGVAIPPGVEIFRWWLPTTFAAMESFIKTSKGLDDTLIADPALQGMIAPILENLRGAIKDIIEYLRTHDRILVVAAAGNDNRWFPGVNRDPGLPLRPEPRWPAQYERVLGVAAVGLKNEPAEYSNRGDVPPVHNGVATFGGNARITVGETLGTIQMPPLDADTDAVRGIYSAERLALGPKSAKNKNGWVYWSGTSFSTPVIAGIAADLWAQWLDDPARMNNTDVQVIDEIVTNFGKSDGGNGADTLACPTISATQKFVKG